MGIQNLKMNKKGLELKGAFYAVIVIGLVITAVGVVVNDWNIKYNAGLTYDLQEYDKSGQISDEAGVQQGKLTPDDPDPGTDSEASTFRGVYGIISNIYSPFRTVFGDGGMLDSATERFGLPDYFRQALVTMMIIAFTTAIIAIIFRLSRRNA